MSNRIRLTAFVLAWLACPLALSAQHAEKSATDDKPMALKASSLTFADITPAGFQPGMQIAVLHGDPGKAEPYTLRLRFPDGYAFPPHWHPNLEHVTVVSGTFYLGMGDTVDKSAAQPYVPGDYLVAPPRQSHFGWVKGETIVQLHGVGPFEVKLPGDK